MLIVDFGKSRFLNKVGAGPEWASARDLSYAASAAFAILVNSKWRTTFGGWLMWRETDAGGTHPDMRQPVTAVS